MTFLIAALTYALHPVRLPTGWSVAIPPYRSVANETRPPFVATMARNGTVAVLLVRARDALDVPRRLLVVRANGTSTILRSESPETTHAFQRFGPIVCSTDSLCPYFENVALARDGTPFVTLGFQFSGAYSGVSRAAFVWNGAWHVVPREKPPFKGAGKPYDSGNVSIAAADTAANVAFVGDFANAFPAEDVSLALADRHWMADVSGVEYGADNIALGEGDATAMRGEFVAGFDGGLKIVRDPSIPTVAITWHCSRRGSVPGDSCTRSAEPGFGVAYGVDSRGNAVGDNEPALGSAGSPILWRDGKALQLSAGHGFAYAISEDGTIVGVSDSRGFVANAHDTEPRARPLDELIQNRGTRRVQTALGIADDGRILAFVVCEDGKHELAVLVPLRATSSSHSPSRAGSGSRDLPRTIQQQYGASMNSKVSCAGFDCSSLTSSLNSILVGLFTAHEAWMRRLRWTRKVYPE